MELSESLDGIKPVKNDKFTVFTLGRACVQKQPQLFNSIAELVPDARFVWIGNGELENELKAPNIEVTGWKPRQEALGMAKGADAFILCSLGEAIQIFPQRESRYKMVLMDMCVIRPRNMLNI